MLNFNCHCHVWPVVTIVTAMWGWNDQHPHAADEKTKPREERKSLKSLSGTGRIRTQAPCCRALAPDCHPHVTALTTHSPGSTISCVSWSLPGPLSDSPEGLPALGETETTMEASWASMLLLARHTYSPESATDMRFSRRREPWAWGQMGKEQERGPRAKKSPAGSGLLPGLPHQTC